MATFDARPVVAVGGESFSDIMAAMPTPGKDEELVVLAPFRAVAAGGRAELTGFSYHAAGLGDGGWQVTFRRAS